MIRSSLPVLALILAFAGCARREEGAAPASSSESRGIQAQRVNSAPEPSPAAASPNSNTALRTTAPSAPETAIRLIDATVSSHITFVHTNGRSGEEYIVETVSSGLATFDYDGDGLIDIYLVNGAPLRGAKKQPPPRNALYRNEGDGTFTDVTEQAGVGDTGYGLGVAAADYDNDGDADLYVTNFGPNVLYRNNGDGTFRDATAEAGVSAGAKVGAGACFLDFDADGSLDLFSANYVDFNYDNHVTAVVGGLKYAHPKDYQPVSDDLFRSNGDGSFTDVSGPAGISSAAGRGMGTVCFDLEDDGDTDIFVANDVGANFLYRNEGNARFVEVGETAGVAYDFAGRHNASMGAECGDFDNDGLLDLFVTNYTGEMPTLYRNLGRGFFEDVSTRTRAGVGAFPHVNWGVGMVDFENDGDRDVLIANGHIIENIHRIDGRTAYRAANLLLMNDGQGRFADVSRQAGDGLAPVESSRGSAFDDLDNDGDIDGVILNANARPTVLRNESSSSNRWVQLELRGARGNRDGVGAKVRIVSEDLSQVAEVHSGRGYQSHYGQRLHFGLGERDRIDRVEIRWLGGETETFTEIAVNERTLIVEGMGEE